MTTVKPVTVRPICHEGKLLSYVQQGVTRYACLNLPAQARAEPSSGRKWPLLIYLHGSRTTPDSLYTLGGNLFDLHDTYRLSGDTNVKGFVLLSPEGRRAKPAESITGTGFHWDEWYRNPTDNLDALAVDHFLQAVLATGLIDPHRVYVFGWSNGAYMAALYGVWRHDRIAAIGQYTGADPWTRDPCPLAVPTTNHVPLLLLRNLCDALVPCSTATDPWIETLADQDWPFEFHSLGLRGNVLPADTQCFKRCPTDLGILEHVRWPDRSALETMLSFFHQHTVG